jgi:hypothetical protein
VKASVKGEIRLGCFSQEKKEEEEATRRPPPVESSSQVEIFDTYRDFRSRKTKSRKGDDLNNIFFLAARSSGDLFHAELVVVVVVAVVVVGPGCHSVRAAMFVKMLSNTKREEEDSYLTTSFNEMFFRPKKCPPPFHNFLFSRQPSIFLFARRENRRAGQNKLVPISVITY